MSQPPEFKVAREVAEQDFDRWVKAMGLRSLRAVDLEDEDKRLIAYNRDVVLDAICVGDLVVNDNGEFVFTPADGDTSQLTFHKPTMAMVRAGDTAKSGEAILRNQRQLGAITKTSAARFGDMFVSDYQVCDSILTLFLVK